MHVNFRTCPNIPCPLRPPFPGPQLFCGLILVSPSCRRPGWWEWGWGSLAARQLYHSGWVPSAKQYFIQRLFGQLTQQALAGESDLVQVRALPGLGDGAAWACCSTRLLGALGMRNCSLAGQLRSHGFVSPRPANAGSAPPPTRPHPTPHPTPQNTHTPPPPRPALRPVLCQAYRRESDQLAPAATAHYLWAALARPDITGVLPTLRCRVLLMYGDEALHRGDCLELACRARKDRLAVLEVAQVCGLRLIRSCAGRSRLCREGRDSWEETAGKAAARPADRTQPLQVLPHHAGAASLGPATSPFVLSPKC